MTVSVLRSTKEPMPFLIGEPVALNGGGVVMTVRSCDKGVVWADWHNKTDDLQSAEFHPDMLHKFEPEEAIKPE